jgi:hypothetical protein
MCENLHKRTFLVKITILLILVVSALQFSNVNAASATLSAGTSWTLKGTYQWSLTGTGSHQGSYIETGDYNAKYFVASSDPSTISINVTNSGTWSCSGQGSVFDQSCGATKSGTWSNTRTWTLYTSTLLVQSSVRGGSARPWWVGHPSWVLKDPSKLSDRGTTPLTWCVPTTDTNDCPDATDVQASVSTQQLSLKGSMVKVWAVTYTGQEAGSYQNSAGVWEVGPETDTYQYDPVYGTVVGASWNYKYEGTEPGGKSDWTESSTENLQFVDSSLTFTTSATVNVEPSANLYVTVDGVKYTSSQLPATFDWVIGSTHTLVVDSTIQGTGVRYVFVKWSNGSTDISRSLTATQETQLTATYKTQYQLTVISDLGNPQGSGWYDAGTQATFSVSSPQPESGFMGTLGGKTVFQAWSGDSNAASPSATINMDGPKTVTATWATDDTQPYTILGGIGAAVIVILVAFLLIRRRSAPPPPPPVIPTRRAAPSQPIVAEPRFCMNCGSPMTYVDQHQRYYCNNCQQYA